MTDRRKRARVALHWRVYLSKEERGPVIQSVTKDVSSDGFYCLCDEALIPGEHLECVMVIPLSSRDRSEDLLRLCCQVRVARVETAEKGQRHGIGCRIEDYSVICRAREPETSVERCAST